MATYRVITGPRATMSGMCCGPKAELSGSPFEKIINEQAKDGYQFVQVFEHETQGALCCIIPKNLSVNLLVFKKG